MDNKNILIIAIGNTGRGDDGLGWQFADHINELDQQNITIEYRYQLQIEDALLLQEYRMVLFADATEELLPGGYALNPCKPEDHYYYSSHKQSPETILYLAKTLYQTDPQAFILLISGYSWELGESLSTLAKKNLSEAVNHVQSWINAAINSTFNATAT
jgi:hydrogenase maturation protease